MSKKVDILVVGGGPAGIISAGTARKYYPSKSVTLIKNIENAVLPCGIPYMFSSLSTPDENKMGTTPIEKKGVSVVLDEVVGINKKEKIAQTKKGEKYIYEKLILAIGSNPIKPPIHGIEQEGIYPINKEMGYLKSVVAKVKGLKNVAILGGGFIGVEFADELSRIDGLNVYLIELLPNLLSNSFDPEFSNLVEEKLKSKGVNVLTNVRAEKFTGNGKVKGVVVTGGREIPVDAVILGIGAVPNTKLAVDAGLDLDKGKGIWVDEYMRTVELDIFAIGDCAAKKDFYTRRNVPVLLASTATAEARVAGANLYELKVVRENKGTIAVYSTYVHGLVLGSAGLTQTNAVKERFEILTGNFEGVDKHPATMPGVSKIKVKLIFSKQSGIILGGQVSGGISCGEMINIISVAVQKRMSCTELETLQMATHPYLTTAPTMYPLVLAAQNVST